MFKFLFLYFSILLHFNISTYSLSDALVEQMEKLLISPQGADRDEIFLKLGEVLSRVIERYGELL